MAKAKANEEGGVASHPSSLDASRQLYERARAYLGSGPERYVGTALHHRACSQRRGPSCIEASVGSGTHVYIPRSAPFAEAFPRRQA